MENKRVVLLDTSVLVDYFRKQNKEKTLFVYLTYNFDELYISSVTEYEIYIEATLETQLKYWESILQKMNILSFDSNAAREAVSLQSQLKTKRKTIDKADLFIAATALSNKMPIATLNVKHFSQIDDLILVSSD